MLVSGVLALLSAALVWGIGNAVTGLTAGKYLTAGSLLPAVDIALANTVGGILLLVCVTFVRRLVGGRNGELDAWTSDVTAKTIFAGALKGTNTCAFVFSTTYIAATKSLVLESTYILWSVLLSVLLFRRRASTATIVLKALLLTLGAILVSSPRRVGAAEGASSFGVLFGLAAGLSYATFLAVWSRVTDGLNSFAVQLLSTIRLLVASAVTIIVVTLMVTIGRGDRFWIPFRNARPEDVMLQTINGAFVIGVVYLLVTLGMTRLRHAREGASVVAAFSLSFSIPFTLLAEVIVGKFLPSGLQLGGAVLFMAAFVLLSVGVGEAGRAGGGDAS